MVICHLCSLKSVKSDSILNFPFKLYETKNSMFLDLFKYIKADINYLHTINNEYNSNIIHEIVYFLVRNTFVNRQYRKQYIWALEILCDHNDITILCNSPNSNDELPLECFIRKSEDKNSRSYEYVKNLLAKHTNKNINMFEGCKVQLDPLVTELTRKYHKFQTKLFSYFQSNYNDCISRCSNCNTVIDMFEDLEKIGPKLHNDKYIDLISITLHHIIILRNQCIGLFEDSKVNERHKYIITYFQNLLNYTVECQS
jgi:hypothetical protein